MENWSNKKVTIKSENKIEIICKDITYKRGVIDFIPTATGQVESKNPGELTLLLEKLGEDLLSVNNGVLSFDDNGKLKTFEIIGILHTSEKSITFSVAPPE
jgi:hypothetical protein